MIRAIEAMEPDAWKRLEDELVRLSQGPDSEKSDSTTAPMLDDTDTSVKPAKQEDSTGAGRSQFPGWLTSPALPVVILFVLPIAVFLLWPGGAPVPLSIGHVLKENGFIELKPPSTLVPPGTWVKVLNSEPTHLGIICPPKTALGLTGEEHLRDSESVSLQMTSSLRGEFDLGSEALESLKNRSEFADIASISFQLGNIRLVEIPDDVVIGGLPDRVQTCREAIRFRTEKGEVVTMIKSVLIADADYTVTFTRELSSDSQADLRRRLALEMDLRLKKDESGVRRMTGRSLIWGVREDRALALKGLGLPATGGTGAVENALPAGATVSTITMEQQKRREFLPGETVIALPVEPIRQTSPMGCWATVCAMMWSWKTGEPTTPAQAVASLGTPWDDFYLEDAGLPPGQERAFADASGMSTLPPANYTIDAWVEMLTTHGPLWIVTGDGISSHARLLVGLYGNVKGEGIAAYEESVFEFIDPLTGTFEYESGLDFSLNFEQEARWLIDGKFDDIELRHQVLFFENGNADPGRLLTGATP